MTMTTQERITRFAELINQGRSVWIEAGKIAKELVEESPEIVDKLAEESGTSAETVMAFVAIGQRTLHPDTLLNDKPGIRALRRQSYSLQEKYLKAPVELLLASGDTLLADVRNLTDAQVKQVFSKNGIRTIAAQRTYIEDLKSKEVQVVQGEIDLPYRVVKGKVIIMQPCTLTKRDLIRLLDEAER